MEQAQRRPSPLAIGDVVDGRFRVLRPIGAGGMGAVYVAKNERTDRDVAVKVLSRDDLGEHATQRFLQEAIACGRIRHLNVVDVHDSGIWNGMPFIAMELLDGESLGARIARGPMGFREALEAMRQAASGLGAAHAAGIVHRDLKPDNLFLATVPGHDGPIVKVLDFGIAKLSAAGSLVQTASSVIFGTPHYMSPEQARGAKHVDLRTDVYSLAATFYEAMSGAPPFGGDNYNQVMVAILSAPLVPLRERAAVPVGVDALIARAMARDPHERYASMPALVDAIDLVLREPARISAPLPKTLASEPPSAMASGPAFAPPTSIVRPPRARLAGPLVIALLLGAAAVVGVYGALEWWSTSRTLSRRPPATVEPVRSQVAPTPEPEVAVEPAPAERVVDDDSAPSPPPRRPDRSRPPTRRANPPPPSSAPVAPGPSPSPAAPAPTPEPSMSSDFVL